MELVVVLLLWFAICGAGMLLLFYGRGAVHMVDKTRCLNDGYAMRPTGYIAHGFQRHYVCPLCNWDTYVVDESLKQKKIREIEGREGR